LMSVPVSVSRWGRAASSRAMCTSEDSHVRAHSAAPVAPAPEPPWASPHAQTVQEAPLKHVAESGVSLKSVLRRSSEWGVLKVHMLCSQDALQRGHLRCDLVQLHHRLSSAPPISPPARACSLSRLRFERERVRAVFGLLIGSGDNTGLSGQSEHRAMPPLFLEKMIFYIVVSREA
jgi:hypothetical protein